MKKLILILFAICVIATNKNAFAGSPTPRKKAISEGTEWSNMWMVSTNNHSLPRVLIMGDSHVERYYQVVNSKIGKKALCCKFTTSRSLGDPSLIAQLKALFFSYKFDVICFNNGLHGTDYTDEQYSKDIPAVYKLFKKQNRNVKIIWVNTTARRVGHQLKDFDKLNDGVINRNKAVAEFTASKNIPLVDVYTPSFTNVDLYDTDGIHFSKKGVEEQARLITVELERALTEIKK
ncbi:MAG: SGNH/GDSL hydrolase family protein [Bacteroidia bacterium]|nr:SGNH/GDSL hydrolase family protein [Bacteroidia bacterium]